MHLEPQEVTDAGGDGDKGHVDKKVHRQLGKNNAPGRAGTEKPGKKVIKKIHLQAGDGKKEKVPAHLSQADQVPGTVRAHQGADRFGQDGSSDGGEEGREPEPSRIFPDGEGVDGRANGGELEVRKIKAYPDGLKDEEDAVVFFDRQKARPEGGPKAPGGGQAVRPRRKCRSRRFVWPWD